MSSDAYRFTIAGGLVTEVFEIEHGVPEKETIEADESYSVIDAATVQKVETKSDYLEIETFTDADGDGIYFVTDKTYEALGAGSDTDDDDDEEDHDSDDDGDGHDDDVDDDGSDDDTHHGLDDDDLVYGSLGSDSLYGGGGDDDLDGGEDDDDLHGDSGADDLYGQSGDDDLDGGDGDDHISGGDGDDVYEGGAGFDTADFSAATVGIELHLSSKSAHDTGEGHDRFHSIEGVTGSDFDDLLEGSRADNNLYGGDGDDILCGKGGSDSMTGGLGADTFVIDYKLKSGEMIDLADFATGEDTLELAAKYFKGVSADTLDECFVIGGAALESDDRLIFDDVSGTLYYDKDGSGRKAAVEIAVIGTGDLSADDISII